MRHALKFSVRRFLTCVGLLLMPVLPGAVHAAEWRALVIGVDAYQHVSPLKGAVNDARDIAETLQAAGVRDLTTLFDEEVTREAVLSNWQGPDRALGARRRPGPVLCRPWRSGTGMDRRL